METTIKIAELFIKFKFDNEKLLKTINSMYKEYLSRNNHADIEINLNYKNNWTTLNGIQKLSAYIENNEIKFKFIKISGSYNFITREGNFDIEDSEIAFYSLLRMLFSYSIAFFDGIYLHASAVFNDKHGIIATGLSGAGKSTFAMTAAKQNYKVIHDDLVLIRKLDDDFKIFSIPFIRDPRFTFATNKSIKLTHMFFLGKSPDNLIIPMKNKEVYKRLMRMILSFTALPYQFHENYLKLIDDLIKKNKNSGTSL